VELRFIILSEVGLIPGRRARKPAAAQTLNRGPHSHCLLAISQTWVRVCQTRVRYMSEGYVRLELEIGQTRVRDLSCEGQR
jgi:hypothetical protein